MNETLPKPAPSSAGSMNLSGPPPSFLDDPEHARMQRTFSDPDTWGGEWDPANDDLINLTLEPREAKADAANLQWIAFQEGKSIAEIAPVFDLYKTRYSQQWFGRPVEKPTEFFELVRGNFNEQERARQYHDAHLNQVAMDSVQAALAGPAPVPERTEDWRVAHPELSQRIPEDRSSRDASLIQGQIQQSLKEQGENLQKLLALQAEMTGKKLTVSLPKLTDPEREALLDELSKMPQSQRAALMEMSALISRNYEAQGDESQRGFLGGVENFIQSTGRAITDPALQTDRTRQHMELDRRQHELRGHTLFYASPDHPGELLSPSDLGKANPMDNSTAPTLAIPKGWREATPAEREQELAGTEQKLKRLQIERELAYANSTSFDPVEPRAFQPGNERQDWVGFASRTAAKVEQGIYDFAPSIVPAALSASPVGTAVLYTATVGQIFEEIMRENPDVNPQAVLGFALAMGAVDTGLNRVKWDVLVQRAPGIRKIKGALWRSQIPKYFKVPIRAGAVLGGEYLTENVQSLIDIAGRQTFEELAPGMKNVPLGDAINELLASQERIIFAVMPFAGFAAGHMALTDGRDFRAHLRDPKELSYLGLAPEQIARITAEPDPKKAAAILQEEYAKLKADQKKRGIKILVDDTKSTAEVNGVPPKSEDIAVGGSVPSGGDGSDGPTNPEDGNHSNSKPDSPKPSSDPTGSNDPNTSGSISEEVRKLLANQERSILEGVDFPESLAKTIDKLYEGENETSATKPQNDPLIGGLSMVSQSPERGTNDPGSVPVLGAGDAILNDLQSVGRQSSMARSGLSDHWSSTSAAFRHREGETRAILQKAVEELERLNPGSSSRQTSRRLFDYLTGKKKAADGEALGKSLQSLKSRIKTLQSSAFLQRLDLLRDTTAEAVIYLDRNSSAIYKAVNINDGRAGHAFASGEVTMDSDGNLHIDYSEERRQTFIEFLDRVARNNSHGGPTPLEFIAVTRDGYAIFKQPFIAGKKIDPSDRANALAKAGLKSIPDIEGHAAVAIVNGKAVLFSDLHSDNILRTADGRIEIIDVLSRELTDAEVEVIKASLRIKSGPK